jgi:polysaccharide biosynthesis/export protein
MNSSQTAYSEQTISGYANANFRDKAERPYILGPGDRVRLKDYDDENLSDQYEINGDGLISIPLAGQVKAAGLTTGQLETAIASRMRGKIARDPKINVEIATYAPFYIYGEVKKAGGYPFQPGLTVADAIATAGGLTYRADENSINVRHSGARSSQVVGLDVPTRVMPGDNIRVSERMF